MAAFQGYADQAARIRDLSVREANSTTSLHSRVFGLAFAAGTCCVLRQYDDLLARADAICALATELNFPFMLAWGMAFRGIAELHAGAGGGQAAWDGLALYRQTNSKWALPFWFGCYVSVQRHPSDETISMIQEGLDAIEATGERWFEAELYRLRGNFVRSLPRGGVKRAEQDFKTAKRIAASQGAKLLELRAATSLARLWSEHGRRKEARELLAPLYS